MTKFKITILQELRKQIPKLELLVKNLTIENN